MTSSSLRPILLVGALLALPLAGCGSRSSLGGYGGAFSGGGGFATGGFGPSGGSPAGGTESGSSSGGAIELPHVLDYFKSSHPTDSANFGAQLALSADGRTLVVGVPGDRSTAVGIDGEPFGLGAPASGAVFVYFRESDTWVQQAYIKASDPHESDQFGSAVSLSDSGDRLAVGAVGENSSAVGIGGDQFDEGADSAGAVYLFSRTGGSWTETSYLKASNPELGDQFGKGLALSSDGHTLAVGAIGEASPATGPAGDETMNGQAYAGAVYVFFDSGFGWAQEAYLKASNTDAYDEFGSSLALSGDGNTLVVGAATEDSSTTSPLADQYDERASSAGAAYVLERVGSAWSQTAYVKASNTGAEDKFGFSVACSSDGSTIAIGAVGEASYASGVNGNQLDDSGEDVGAVYVLERNGSEWEQIAYVKASNPQTASFGLSVALSADGGTLLVGAPGESSATVGINGNQDDGSAPAAGAAYLLRRGASGWQQRAYLKAHNSGPLLYFGYAVALSADGQTAALGAPYESGSSPGINGDPGGGISTAGAAYVYTFK